MVWILLGIGLLLVIFNLGAINKEKSSFKYIFNNTEEDMKEMDFKLSEIRREFSETILELQKEIEKVKETYIYENKVSENNILEEPKDIEENNENYTEDNIVYKEEKEQDILESSFREKKVQEDNNVKINEINKLLSKGFSIEEISEKIGIGKGEVLLIKELYLK
jgi:hypothetical protein